MKPIAAALAVALMGMGGVALAAPKADPGPSEPGQGIGPAPQGQANAPAPQANAPAPQAKAPAPRAHDPAPPPQAKARQGAGKPAGVPPAQPPQPGAGSNQGSATGPGGSGHHGRPAATHGQGQSRSTRAKSGTCRLAGCRHGGPKPTAGASGGGEQPQPVGGSQDGATGDAPGGSGGRPDDDQAGTVKGEHQAGAPESGAVLGANQGAVQEVEPAHGSFDTALPFTGFELVLLAGIGTLLWLAGVRLRRSAA